MKRAHAMPTTEQNARSIAFSKGLVIEKRGRRLVAVDPKTEATVVKASTWSDMLCELLKAPRAGAT